MRMLRHRYHISVTELASHASLSKQYISRAELGEITATARLEAQLSAALEAAIFKRQSELRALEQDYMIHKGNLLTKGEHPNEQ